MQHPVACMTCLVLAVTAVWGESAHRAVGIFMEFESTPVAASLEAMEHDVGALLQASGVTLDWRFVKQNQGTESFAGLVLLKFKGTCRAESAVQPATDFGSLGETRPLGTTKVSHGHVLPYTEVQCDQVREALSYLAPGADRKTRQNAYTRALARVVAHELYHVLARTTGHAAAGLAKASHSLEDLVSPKSLDFRDEDSRAIERGVEAGLR